MNTIYKYLGYILILSAIFRIVPIISGLVYNESILSFIISTLISLALGYYLVRTNNNPAKISSLNITQAFSLVALSFIVLPLLGSISFLKSFDYNIFNAIFESVSGFTTTGLTLYDSLENLPKSLLIWRALTQWIGGIGIVMVFLFIISRLKMKSEKTNIESAASLYETQGLELESNLKTSTRNVIIIYSSYTLLGIILLFFSGMSFFESIALSFTSISTGGFIVTDSLQINNPQLIILTFMMLLGSISFITHNKLLTRRFKDFFLAREKNIFIFVVFITVLLSLVVFDNVQKIIFEMVSAFSTTGFSLSTISTLPHLMIMLIIIGMIIGGGIASTAGGIKISRIYTLLAMVPWTLKKIISPRHAIIPFKVNNKVVEPEENNIVVVYVAIYFTILVSGTIIFLLLGNNFLDSAFQITSALGTVGLQTMSLATLPIIGKVILVLAMILGRLEIFPIIILVRNLLKKSF